MDLEDSPHECQADPGTVRPGVQLVEQAKDAVMVFRRDAQAVVTDVEDRLASLLAFLPDLDTWLLLIPHELGGIVEQVLQDFHQARTVAVHLRQIWLNLYGNLM